MVLCPDLNVKSLIRSGRVFCNFLGTWVYSQLRHPQNSAPHRRVALAFSRVERAVLYMYLYTSMGRAFWCLVGGSRSW